MRMIALTLALLMAAPSWAADIMVIDPYARAARPGAPTGAVFMTLQNSGQSDDRLIGASSPLANVAQIHTHIDDNGVMRMREMKGGVPLPPKSTHLFERGGDHVMLMGLKADLIDGETLPLTLVFEVAGELTIDVPIDNERGQGNKAHKP